MGNKTESLWYPYQKGLMCIQGVYFKRWLNKHPPDHTHWEKWRRRFPGSEVFK